MLNISKIAEQLPASPIRKLVPYALAAKAKGVKVYHLNIGQPDIESPVEALSAIREYDQKVLEYTHSAGIESYRVKLAEFYNSRGLNIKVEDLLVTTGGSEALFFSMLAICNPGDEIIIPEPFYANYNSFALEAGVKIVPITAVIENGFALPTAEAFERLISPRTRAILICNPNNPTGYLYTQSEIEALKELVLKHNLYLLSDEVYSDFCYDGKKHFSVLELEGAEDNIIMCDSVSKRYSMCGVRIGVIVSRNAAILDAALRMGQARLCAPLLGQVAAEAALDAPQSYFDKVKSQYVERRDFVISALSQMEGVVAPNPGGAFYVVAGLPIDSSENFAQWLLEDYSFEGATVMVAPAQGFYSNPKECVQNQIRIAYVLEIEELRGAMQVLEEAIKVYRRDVMQVL
ncbi:MAG: pyridoxal phosphate-dependent aminotransferase [Rikenellaceae bacterium]